MLSTEGTAIAVLTGSARWHVGHGDCLEQCRLLPDNSVDALVTDSPGGIGFMGKDWDSPTPGERIPLPIAMREVAHAAHFPNDRRFREREWFVWWLAERFAEAYRVLKPGAHGLAWSLPRTSHWIGLALELAGFEIFDQVEHLFSQGMGKSKSARRMLAMENCTLPGGHHESSLPPESEREPDDHVCADHYPETEWDGYGTGLAPSHEGWWLFRKPLEGTIAQNIVKWRTGVINIDESRVPRGDDLGGWPKDVVLTHAPGCTKLGTALIPANPTWDTPGRDTEPSLFTGGKVSKVRHGSREGEASAVRRYTDRGSASFARTPGRRRDEMEEVDVWECETGCAAFALAEQGGETKSGYMRAGTERSNRFGYTGPLPERVTSNTYGDKGPVTRFFLQLAHPPSFVPYAYQPKPKRAEKDAGLRFFRRRSAAEATESEEGQARLKNARTGAGRTGNVRNMHGTTKGVEWMKYLVRMVTPPGGSVLDLFSGSGTTGVAAVCLDRRFIGYELLDTEKEPHVSIARARIHYAAGGGELVPRESLR